MITDVWIQILPWSVFFVTFPLAVRYIFGRKRAITAKRVMVVLVILIISAIIPLLKINGDRQSIIQIIAHGSISFLFMFLGYITALFFLLKGYRKSDLLSAAAYCFAYFFALIGIYNNLPVQIDSTDLEIVGFIIYFLLPMVGGLFYIGLTFKKAKVYKL